MIYVILAIMLATIYLVWWEWLFDWGERPPADQHPPLPYVLKFNAPIARLARWLSGAHGKNYAVTLPHPWKRKVVVFVALHFIEHDHLAHEVGGHGYQVATMGPVDYTSTYVWHFGLRRGSWKHHMMEIEADEREADYKHEYGNVGTP